VYLGRGDDRSAGVETERLFLAPHKIKINSTKKMKLNIFPCAAAPHSDLKISRADLQELSAMSSLDKPSGLACFIGRSFAQNSIDIEYKKWSDKFWCLHECYHFVESKIVSYKNKFRRMLRRN
jgi:hypothetical protein